MLTLISKIPDNTSQWIFLENTLISVRGFVWKIMFAISVFVLESVSQCAYHWICHHPIDGLVQGRHNSSALTMELLIFALTLPHVEFQRRQLASHTFFQSSLKFYIHPPWVKNLRQVWKRTVYLMKYVPYALQKVLAHFLFIFFFSDLNLKLEFFRFGLKEKPFQSVWQLFKFFKISESLFLMQDFHDRNGLIGFPRGFLLVQFYMPCL